MQESTYSQVTEALKTRGFDSIEAVFAELNQVKQERDAAVNDLNYAGSFDGEFCSICKYSEKEECEKRKFEHMECWEWRGVKSDNVDAFEGPRDT